MNCGANGCTVPLPRWTVESIREQASWVGKRYYPHEEDIETNKEIQLLRALAPDDPERTVTQCEDDPRRWETRQPTEKGWTSTWVTADSEAEAREKAKLVMEYRPRRGHVGPCIECKKDKVIGPSPLLADGTVICYQCIVNERTRTIARLDGEIATARQFCGKCQGQIRELTKAKEFKCPVWEILKPKEDP
jgi:hypothetical protein